MVFPLVSLTQPLKFFCVTSIILYQFHRLKVVKFIFQLILIDADVPASEKFKIKLFFLLSKYFKNVDFNIVLVNSFKVFFSYRDRLPKAMCASLVYKFSCALCASEYVGSTTRTLHTKIAEHAGRSFRTGSILSVSTHSMVRTHSESYGVPVTLNDFLIIGSHIV